MRLAVTRAVLVRDLHAQTCFAEHDLITRLQPDAARAGGHWNRRAVAHDRGAVCTAIVGDAVVVRLAVVVDVGVSSRNGIVRGAATIRERDVIRANQTLSVITHVFASSEIDARLRQRVEGPAGDTIGNRQRDLVWRRGLWRGSVERCAVDELDVILRRDPGRLRLCGVDDAHADTGYVAAGGSQTGGDRLVKGRGAVEHGREPRAFVAGRREDDDLDAIEWENTFATAGGFDALVDRLEDRVQHFQWSARTGLGPV